MFKLLGRWYQGNANVWMDITIIYLVAQYAHHVIQILVLNVISMLETPVQLVQNVHQIYLDYSFLIIVYVRMAIMTQDLHYVLYAQQFAFYVLPLQAVSHALQIYSDSL